MNDKKASTTSSTEEIGSSESLPKDINFEARKKIVRDELAKILGRPKISEAKRLKHEGFLRKKVKAKIAKASRRKNKIKR